MERILGKVSPEFVNVETDEGNTALHIAALCGKDEAVRVLVTLVSFHQSTKPGYCCIIV